MNDKMPDWLYQHVNGGAIPAAQDGRSSSNSAQRVAQDPQDATVALSARLVEAAERAIGQSVDQSTDDWFREARAAVVAVLNELQDSLMSRARQRNEADTGEGEECAGDDCEHNDCHTISATATWVRAAHLISRTAHHLIEGTRHE